MAKIGKKETTALQTEVNTEEEWKQLLTRKGLILADIYSEWSGPCTAMLTTLRQIKMEIGGDTISYAVVRNDDIPDLERFRGKSEPVWMFIQDGKIVNLMFGAHCPNLRRLLIDEIRRVEQEDEPKWKLEVNARSPEEEVRWQQEESIRKAIEEKQRAEEEAEQRERYEAFLAQMMFELCEETAMILYPWVFKDENGRSRDKHQSPPYTELVQDLFRQNFDVLEEHRVQLNEELIEKMFVESGIEITKELVAGLTDGKCMAMRLKGKRPHPDWPVPYPHKCPEGTQKCPTRAIDDIENYLLNIITSTSLLLPPEGANVEQTPYIERHVYVYEPDPEIEDDFPRVDPAVWVPPQARSKVHVLKTLFSNYMEVVHPYEEPAPIPPLCAFKYNVQKFSAVRDACTLHQDAVEHFGAFEFDDPEYARRMASSPEDFEKKVRHVIGTEVFIVVVRRVNEEAFLSFAGIDPYFVTEDNAVAEELIDKYFPEGMEDAVIELSDEQEFLGEEEFEEDEDQEEEEEEENPIEKMFALF